MPWCLPSGSRHDIRVRGIDPVVPGVPVPRGREGTRRQPASGSWPCGGRLLCSSSTTAERVSQKCGGLEQFVKVRTWPCSLGASTSASRLSCGCHQGVTWVSSESCMREGSASRSCGYWQNSARQGLFEGGPLFFPGSSPPCPWAPPARLRASPRPATDKVRSLHPP